MDGSSASAIGSIDLLIKPTLECNARCIYCHSLKPAERLSRDLLQLIFKKWAAFVQKEGVKRLSITWHGGEPMIMGARFYEGVRELEQKYFPSVKISHGMQSNVCLYKGEIRETLLELLSERSIGACLDPFHPTRLLPGGADYFGQSVRGCLSLMNDGFAVNMIYVVHKKSLDVVRDVYYFFKNLRVNNILFHPLEDFQGHDYRLTPEEWGVFLRDLWRVWEEDQYRLPVFPLNDWRERLVFGEPVPSCEHGMPKENHVHLVISPEGNVYPCHRFQDKDIFCIGNIGRMSFAEVMRHEWTRLLSRQKGRLCETCSACEFLDVCRGGCVATHQPNGKTIWCEGLKAFFGFLKERRMFEHVPDEVTISEGGRCPRQACN